MTMASCMTRTCNQLVRMCYRDLLLVYLLLCLTTVDALKHSFSAFADSRRLIGPVGTPFGFTAGGHYELTVYDFTLLAKDEEVLKKVEAGFFLQRFDNEAAFYQHMEVLRANASLCVFDDFRDPTADDLAVLAGDDDEFQEMGEITSAANGILLSMKSRKNWKPATPTIEYTFQKEEEGLYFLMYQVCSYNANIRSTFELDFHFKNYDSFGRASYLTAGEMNLPLIFFFFSISYFLCLVIWFTNNREIMQGRKGHFTSIWEGQPKVYPIHHLMTVLLVSKFLSIFFESVRYHAIRVSGHAELWSVVYYLFTFIKGTFLFTVILLIGTGWSFVKPFLNDREKKVIFVVLILQVVNNLALVVLSQETEGENSYQRWTAILHLVDIICCCAVLVPIVWQVNALEKSVGGGAEEEQEVVDEEEREMALESGEKGQILSKLKLFRSFYLLVVAYIYSTRILVYLFATMLDYRHLWVRYFVVELLTLTFYVVVGMMFRPMADNPYLSVRKNEEDEGIALQNGLELERTEYAE